MGSRVTGGLPGVAGRGDLYAGRIEKNRTDRDIVALGGQPCGGQGRADQLLVGAPISREPGGPIHDSGFLQQRGELLAEPAPLRHQRQLLVGIQILLTDDQLQFLLG